MTTREPGYSGEVIRRPKEVERKFLVNPEEIPFTELSESHEADLYQAYVAIAEDGSEMRVRMIAPVSEDLPDTYELTLKTKGGISRDEQTIPISEEMYHSLSDSSKREGDLIMKRRLTIPHGDTAIELDLYDGNLHGLSVAEVEFRADTEEEMLAMAEAFVPPAWFGDEVTEDDRYKNQSLALHGRPA